MRFFEISKEGDEIGFSDIGLWQGMYADVDRQKQFIELQAAEVALAQQRLELKNAAKEIDAATNDRISAMALDGIKAKTANEVEVTKSADRQRKR